MILIADSGSTKTDWCRINPEGENSYFKTEGYNPYFADSAYIEESMRSSIPESIDPLKVTEVHFYGAGCQDDKIEVMRDILRSVFPNCKKLSPEVDLLAAARGLLGNNAGFAAILGTGMNTCIYDGQKVNLNIDSLGYVLGDEGSGAAIGKKILSDFLRDKMPEAVKKEFTNTFKLSPSEIIHRIYMEPLANRFCASFVPFLNQTGIDSYYRHRLIKSSFTEFFKNLVSYYPGYTDYTFNCIGSVGFYFRDILSEVLIENKMKPGRIQKSLIHELVTYHSAENHL